MRLISYKLGYDIPYKESMLYAEENCEGSTLYVQAFNETYAIAERKDISTINDILA